MGLNLLALDTSTPRAAIALATPRGIFTHDVPPGSDARHGRTLLPSVRELLASIGMAVADLDGFVVGLGPGSYTGLRVGVMAVKTLAFALGKGLAGLDSLELIARNAPDDVLRVSVIADAQRGDLYAADFTRPEVGAALVRSEPTRVVPLTRWSAELREGSLVLGPGAATNRGQASIPNHATLLDDPGAHAPDSRRLAELAVEVWASGRREDLWFVEPVYLRRSAAEDQWEKLGRPR
ncbi:MAG: tRNA (adenosine(37)-N6)-threonylcarbamoyltransferase complex dimerization subunit type 1 TsaB [Isosphaeraceae bacterium]